MKLILIIIAFLLSLHFGNIGIGEQDSNEESTSINNPKTSYLLVKDKYGIPNKNGLVFLHTKTDSIYIAPTLVEDLVLKPHWDRPTFPIEVLNFPNIKHLYIGMRSFETMPEEIAQLSKLESIDLQNSKFKCLPDNIDELKELRELILLFSDVEELPISICNLKKLKRLHLGGTKIQKLPECLGELKQLEEFILFYETEEFSEELQNQLEKLKINLPNCEFHLG